MVKYPHEVIKSFFSIARVHVGQTLSNIRKKRFPPFHYVALSLLKLNGLCSKGFVNALYLDRLEYNKLKVSIKYTIFS